MVALAQATQWAKAALGSDTGPVSATFASDTVAGHGVIVTVEGFGSAFALTDVTDNKGNTYTRVASGAGGATSAAAIFYCAAIQGAGANHTVTVTDTGIQGKHIGILEATTALNFDRKNQSNGTVSPISTNPTQTLASPNEIVVANTSGNNSTLITYTDPAGWTQIGEVGAVADSAGSSVYQIVSATTSLNPQWTYTGTLADWRAAIAAFYEQGWVPPFTRLLGPGSQGPQAFQWRPTPDLGPPDVTTPPPPATVWLPGNIVPQFRRTLRASNRPGGTVPFPPQADTFPAIRGNVQASRRAPLLRRGRQATIPPAQVAAPAAPSYPVTAGMARRLRGLLPRRGRTVGVFTPADTPAPVSVSRGRRTWTVRRGHLTALPTLQPVPQPITRARVVRGWLRRGRAVTPVPAQVNPPYPLRSLSQARAVRGWPVRRGRQVTPTPAQQAATPNPLIVFRATQRRLVQSLLRRGHQTSPVPPQVNPPLPLSRLGARVRGIPRSRPGRTVTPSLAQQVPPSNRQLRVRGIPRRRGARPVATPPIIQAAPILPLMIRRIPRRLLARIPRRILSVFGITVSPPPPAPVPEFPLGTIAVLDGRYRTSSVADGAQGTTPVLDGRFRTSAVIDGFSSTIALDDGRTS